MNVTSLAVCPLAPYYYVGVSKSHVYDMERMSYEHGIWTYDVWQMPTECQCGCVTQTSEWQVLARRVSSAQCSGSTALSLLSTAGSVPTNAAAVRPSVTITTLTSPASATDCLTYGRVCARALRPQTLVRCAAVMHSRRWTPICARFNFSSPLAAMLHRQAPKSHAVRPSISLGRTYRCSDGYYHAELSSSWHNATSFVMWFFAPQASSQRGVWCARSGARRCFGRRVVRYSDSAEVVDI